MSEFVDRVALTIAQHFRDPKTPMNEAQAVALFSDVARKVVAEMREPTYAMIDNNPYLELSHEAVRGCWAWFIEEALK